jgi:hypothetical protein
MSPTPQAVDCRKKFRFQVAVEIPNTKGVLAAPAAGVVTGVLLRLSATKNGAAIHADVNALATTEASGLSGTFYAEVSKTLLETHILPLGVGLRFYAIWSKAGDMDLQYTPFTVVDGTEV